MSGAVDLVRGITRIASLPEVVLRLEETLADPRANFADFSRIIAEDSALSARLLRIVNSGFYQFPQRIETISAAITVIGTRQLHALVQASSIMRLFDGISSELVDMERFWRHSIGCGTLARAIATQRRSSNVERYYVLGLLHDIGRLILFVERPQQAAAATVLVEERGLMLFEAEYEVFGFDHGAVTRALLESWKLPASLSEPAALHHAPLRARKYAEDSAVIHLADIMAHTLHYGTSGELRVPPLVPAAWDALGLAISQLQSVVEHADRQYHDAVELFMPGKDES